LKRSNTHTQIDGVNNPKVQSIYLSDLPIYNAKFNNNGEELIATGRRPIFYVYDIVKGKIIKIPGIKGNLMCVCVCVCVYVCVYVCMYVCMCVLDRFNYKIVLLSII